MLLKGEWASNFYKHLKGTMSILIPENYKHKSYFDCEVILYYSHSSPFMQDISRYLHMEGIYEEKILDDGSADTLTNSRFLIRNKNLKMEQYHTCCFSTVDNHMWSGFLTSVYPFDGVAISLTTIELDEEGPEETEKSERSENLENSVQI